MQQHRKTSQKTYLIANVNVNPSFEVVKDLFKVPCPGSSQVTGITVRLERRRAKREADKRERERGGELLYINSDSGHMPIKLGTQQNKNTYKCQDFTVPERTLS